MTAAGFAAQRDGLPGQHAMWVHAGIFSIEFFIFLPIA
jgi:hypothetical protein